MGKGFEHAIVKHKLLKRKKLYGFDGGKDHTFVYISFTWKRRSVQNLLVLSCQ